MNANKKLSERRSSDISLSSSLQSRLPVIALLQERSVVMAINMGNFLAGNRIYCRITKPSPFLVQHSFHVSSLLIWLRNWVSESKQETEWAAIGWHFPFQRPPIPSFRNSNATQEVNCYGHECGSFFGWSQMEQENCPFALSFSGPTRSLCFFSN